AMFAQATTGRLTGNTTLDGSPLPGVTVTIQSPSLQGVRVTYSDTNGNYNFGALPPGSYSVTFEMESMNTITRQVDVTLTGVARADANLQLAAMAEAITVTADAPTVVETQEIQTNIKAELVENLPLARTLIGTVSLAPGVNNNGPGGNTTISGAPSYDSTFYINGSVVNEVLRGQPLNVFIEDALQETTVLTGAISAEYGRFTGGVVTAVSKSGGNEFSGSLRDSLTNPKWNEATPLGENRIDNLSETYEGTLGGRIIRDRLWFFTAGRYVENAQSNFFNQSTIPYTTTAEQRRLEGKLTGQVTPKHTLVGSILELENEISDRCLTGAGCWEARTLSRPEDQPQDLLSVSYSGILTNSLLLEANYSDSSLTFSGSGGPVGDRVSATNINFAAVGGQGGASPFCGACDDEVRATEALSFKGTYYLSTSALGSHNLVAGYEDFSEQLFSNNHQSGSDFTVWTFASPTRADDGSLVTSIGRNAGFIIYWPILQSSLGNDFTTQSFFINDKWDLNSNLSFNIGGRYDVNDGRDSAGAKVADDSKISPRLGVIYDVHGDGRIRFNASYSEYVSKISNGNIGDAASPAGSPSILYWLYGGPTVTGVSSQELLSQIFAWFDSVGGIDGRDFLLGGGTNGVSSQIRGSLVSPGVNEFSVGAAFSVGRSGFLRVDYQDRDWSDFYTTRTDLSTGRVFDPLAGEDLDLALTENSNDFVREYQAVILQGGARVFNRLDLGGSYTWSELRGNHGGETTGSGPIASVGRNWYPEFLGYAQNNPVGFLPADQTHKVRAWASYDLPTPAGNFNVSLLQRFDSGTPYSAIGAIDVTSSGNTTCPVCRPNDGLYVGVPSGQAYYFSERGEFRWDDVTATDLALNYSLPLGRVQLFVQGELINAFNESAQVGGNTTVLTARDDPSLLPFDPFTETPVEGVHYRFGSNFGNPLTPTSQTRQGHFQLPRTYRGSVGIRF
ncbi:MAG TPA: TonB-dependent receptor, partial [Thermoanaerobaculia bacterium]|nr:TonB-dependent receptor [Thermoanaerobaculia bacterium]